MIMAEHEIKQRLDAEISKTKEVIEAYQEMTKPISPDVAIGRISRLAAINNKSVTEAALRQAEEKLRNLNRVSAKIGTKDFGLCMKCKLPIPIGRILIRPESLFCVNCAQ
jgi:DnaK suppressor protein